jgi:hypothetical protein
MGGRPPLHLLDGHPRSHPIGYPYIGSPVMLLIAKGFPNFVS